MRLEQPLLEILKRPNLYRLLEHHTGDYIPAIWLNRFFIVLILLNVTAVILDSIPSVYAEYHGHFLIFETVSVAIFTLEYLGRIYIAPEAENPEKLSDFRMRLKYMLSPMGIIDLLAILPFFLHAYTALDLRMLRIIRLLRLLKLSHYFRGLNFFITVLKKEMMSIGSAVFTMLVLVLLSASLMYFLEHKAQPEAFASIPDAIWWAVVTMTTVGYGDVTPITLGGKLLAIFIMLMGVGIVALPAGILAARFGDELQSRKNQLTAHVIQALKDGHLSDLEQHELNILREKLEISEDELQRIIEAESVKTSEEVCPHCHKPLS